MAIAHGNVTARTGETYSTTSDPTDTQVTNFITGAKNLYRGEAGAAVDETNQTQIEIVLDIVENMVHNYKEEKKSLATPSLIGAPQPKMRPLMGDDIRRKIQNHLHPSTWFVESGLTYER